MLVNWYKPHSTVFEGLVQTEKIQDFFIVFFELMVYYRILVEL